MSTVNTAGRNTRFPVGSIPTDEEHKQIQSGKKLECYQSLQRQFQPAAYKIKTLPPLTTESVTSDDDEMEAIESSV